MSMTKKDYELIATEIWRSGYIKDKNKVRQQAKEHARRLVAFNLSSALFQDNPSFNAAKFLQVCGIE